MKSRKVLSILVAVIMVFGSFTVSFAEESVPAATAGAATFSDVTGHWGAAAIEKWSGYGIINGYEGFFRPDDSITRGEMAVILDNMMDYQVAATNTFSDLQAGQFYTDAVLKANAAGIMKGDGVIVRPTDKITKEEAAIMLSRAFAVAGANSTKAFLDASAVSDWAKSAVFGMEAKGYVSGFGGYFNPKANITRAEAVTMINNIVKAYYATAGTYTENVAGTAIIKVADVKLKGVTISENLIIAEGVGKGDAYLDSVTVKGDTVVRGGGENSIHITGTSSITKITIEKIGDKIRVVIDDGINVPEVQIGAANEEIVITGSVGTVDVQAPNATVLATAAEIKTATITGDNSKIIVGAQATITNVTVASTAKNTTVETQTGGVVNTVTASAPVTVSGTGTVSNVTLNAGANGSSITTPKTTTTVGSGVTGVTGTGGTSIPAGSTGTNGTTETAPATVVTTPTTPSGGGGGGGTGDTVNHPDFSLTDLKYNSSAISIVNGIYQVPVAALTGSNAIDVTVVGSGFDATKVYSMTVTVSRTAPNSASQTETIDNIAGGLLNQTHTDTYTSLADLLDYYTNTLSTITSGAPVSSFTSFLSTQGVDYAYTVTFTYNNGTTSGQLDGGVFKFVLIP